MRTLMVLIYSVLILLLTCKLTFAGGADAVQVGGEKDGKGLQLSAELQKRLVEASVRLLPSCSNTVIQPKNTLENARRKSHLHFTFIEPRSLDLGIEKTPLTTGVQVKEIVITLPLSSGGAWIDSTKFRFYCSKFDTNITQEMEEILKSAQTP